MAFRVEAHQVPKAPFQAAADRIPELVWVEADYELPATWIAPPTCVAIKFVKDGPMAWLLIVLGVELAKAGLEREAGELAAIAVVDREQHLVFFPGWQVIS